MDIGLLLHTRQLIRAEDATKSFGHLWADAAQAEEFGFDHIWLGDSVTVLDKARGDCLTTMAALAARHQQDSSGNRADAAGVAQSGAARPRAGDHRCNFQRQNYFRRQRRSGARLHSAPICRLRRAAPGKGGKTERDHRDHAPVCGARPRSTTKAVTSNCTMSASCPARRSSPAFPSGSSPTATTPVSSASPVWATVGSRWRRHSNDSPAPAQRSLSTPKAMAEWANCAKPRST